MKIIRYLDAKNNTRFGAEEGDGSVRELSGDLFGDLQRTNNQADVKKLLAPLVPSAIFCIGLNYRFHAEESGSPLPDFPVLFMKSPGAVQNPEDPIELPVHLKSMEVDYEAELAVVIKRRCKNVSREEALNYVLGYTCANDVSARDWQIKKGGSQWCRGKTFDTFAPLGPRLITSDELTNPNDLQIQTMLNGKLVQDWNTNDMIFDVPALIEFLSGSTTLLPGTTILTGTPHGVGMARKPPLWLEAGDSVTIKIEKVGELTNPVIEERI